MTFPQQQILQQHLYPHHVQYVVVQPQYAPLSLPRSSTPASEVVSTPPPPPPAGAMPLPGPQIPPPPARVVPFMPVSESISAWLNSSRLSSSKKNVVYWANVTGVYNRDTSKDQKWARVQLKYHWQKINAPETETGEQDSMSAKKKQETELQEPGCSELQEDIQCPGPRRHSVHCLMSRSDGATLGHQCVEAAVLAAPLAPPRVEAMVAHSLSHRSSRLQWHPPPRPTVRQVHCNGTCVEQAAMKKPRRHGSCCRSGEEKREFIQSVVS
ncbi:unnamed protein product [Miscanthus lutarioriparius]|uniref:Uncharacterized protein n=1 Tax=Miscanthus lutarioriparius TaxID=422564 RepID=A0A811RE31_9POAL|nr:unnamed protein product [Miscanthus lutarioriparius]